MDGQSDNRKRLASLLNQAFVPGPGTTQGAK